MPLSYFSPGYRLLPQNLVSYTYMLKSQIPAKESLLLRLVASLAYMACLLQWFWAMVLYLPLIRQTNIMELFVTTPSEPRQIVATTPAEPSILMMIIVVLVTVILIGLTIYALAKTPGAIRKAGNTATNTTAKKVVIPAITGKKHISKKKLSVLTLKIEFMIKLALVVVAFIISSFAYLSPIPLEYRVILVTSGGLALLSLVFFVLEFCIKIRRRSNKKS